MASVWIYLDLFTSRGNAHNTSTHIHARWTLRGHDDHKCRQAETEQNNTHKSHTTTHIQTVNAPHKHTHTLHLCCFSKPYTWHGCSGKRLILLICRLINSHDIKPDKPANQIPLGHQTPKPPLKIPHAVINSGCRVAINTLRLSMPDSETNKHRDHTGGKQFTGGQEGRHRHHSWTHRSSLGDRSWLQLQQLHDCPDMLSLLCMWINVTQQRWKKMILHKSSHKEYKSLICQNKIAFKDWAIQSQ